MQTKNKRPAKRVSSKPKPGRATLRLVKPDRLAKVPIIEEPKRDPSSLGRRCLDLWIALAAPGPWERKKEVVDEIANLLDAQGYTEADPTERLIIDRLAIATLQSIHAETMVASTVGRNEAATKYWSSLQVQSTNMLFQATKALGTYRKFAGIKRIPTQGPKPPRSELDRPFGDGIFDRPILHDDPEAELMLQRATRRANQFTESSERPGER